MQLPYFCGHVPQESGTRVGVSLSEKLTKRPRHAYNYPSNSAGGCSIFTCEISEVKSVHKIFDGGERKKWFECESCITELVQLIC